FATAASSLRAAPTAQSISRASRSTRRLRGRIPSVTEKRKRMSSALPTILALLTASGLTLAYGWSRGARASRQFASLLGVGMLIAGLLSTAVGELDAGMGGVVLLAGVLLAWGVVAVHLADQTAKGSLTELSG